MNNPHDPNRTVDVPSVPADSLDAGLAARFGRPADGPGSVLSGLRESLGNLRPVLLQEAEGESAHIVKLKSDAMPPPEQTGDRYQLAGEIARGGMGAVLRGRDVDLGRDLAIKVLLEKYANRPEVARRFIEEAQIGGQLQHPGVVPVYDIGCFGDRPFFTMKLVKGQTLQALLRERADPAADRPRFLAIALQVAQTVAYAHAKGVIHRDLKPANVMVGAFGEVQVMDWGLAKVLAEGGVADEEKASRAHQVPQDETTIRTARSTGSSVGTDTEAGSLLGTPAYMPPEQANGDVAHLDRRADVFGLGAILCEILTGKPPYVGRSSEEVRRKACNGDLADATARLDACGADAELIVLTKSCLAAEAIDRPKDAQAVAEALSTYRNGVQERLRQSELAEAEAKAKAVEEAKRRRLTLALAASVLCTVILGGSGWIWVLRQEAQRERQELAQQVKTTQEINDALAQAAELREQAQLHNDASKWADARARAKQAEAFLEGSSVDPALAARVRAVVRDLEEEEKDRRLLASLGRIRLLAAETDIHENRFTPELDLPLLRQAFRDYGIVPGEGDPRAAAAQILQRPEQVRDALVSALDDWIRRAEDSTLKLPEPHLAWLRQVAAAADPDPWRQQVRAAAMDSDVARRRAALCRLAVEAEPTRQPARALVGLSSRLNALGESGEAVKLLLRAQPYYPGDIWINEQLGFLLLGGKPRRLDEGVGFLTAAVALRPDSIGARLNLGIALRDLRRLDGAVAQFQEAIRLNPEYAAAHLNLGWAWYKEGKPAEALAAFGKAISLEPDLASAHLGRGAVLCDQKQDYQAAIAAFRKAIALQPDYPEAYYNLGVAFSKQGKANDAAAAYRKAASLRSDYVEAYQNLGALLCDKVHDYPGAIAAFREAIKLEPDNPAAHFGLGNSLTKQGAQDEAVASYRKAIDLKPTYADAHNNLGRVLEAQRKPAEAMAEYREAIRLQPDYVTAYLGLGSVLCDQVHDYAAARAAFEKAISYQPDNAVAHYDLGNTYLSQNRLKEAAAAYRQTIALKKDYAEAYCNLASIFIRQGKLDEAQEACRQAIESKPGIPHPHWHLAQVLRAKGDYAGSLAAYERGHQLNSAKGEGAKQSALWVKEAQRLAQLEGKLPAVLQGQVQAADAAERIDYAGICTNKKLYVAAARFATEAFTADPKLADLKLQHRYNAACAAALAGCGQGNDAGQLDDGARARWRNQALAWLQADLALLAEQLQTDKPARCGEIRQTLEHWQQDADLAGIRDAAARAKLPAEERAACGKLWADVAGLLKRAEEMAK
jgi:tetratricopeptide (TPR) repeat protein